MKITFVLPTVDMSGGIRVIAIYARKLAERGHSVTLVSTPRAARRKLDRIKKALGLFPRLKSHLDGIGVAHRVIDRVRPVSNADVPDSDVVIATWWETAEWVAALSPAKGNKFYFVQHHEIFPSQPQDRVHATYRLPLRKIAVARWLKDVIARLYGEHDVVVVPNSVDHAQFHAEPRDKQARPTVGFTYSTSEFKGASVALAAIASLRRDMPDLKVVSFGMHEPHKDLVQDIEFFADPPQNSLRDVYAKADVWLSTSRSEGFNLPAMEAMACRTPVVSTKTGWPEEAIVTGLNGALVPVDDAAAVAAAAKDILTLSNPDWRRMSQAAFDTVRDSSWDRSTELFEAALSRAAGLSSAQAASTTHEK